MSESNSHKRAANKIARKLNTDYNNGKGIDINTTKVAIEVETESTVSGGIQQLQGHRKPSYIAGANLEAVKKALEATEGTTVGVMDSSGNIVKKSTRKR